MIMMTSDLLFEAISKGDAETVERIVSSAPALLESRGHDSLTPLMKAISMGSIEIIRILSQKGADWNAPRYVETGMGSALEVAVSKGNATILEAVIELGCPVNDKKTGLCLPFLYAAHDGRLDLMDILLNAGANVKTKYPHGDTALTLICRFGPVHARPADQNQLLKIVKRLIDSGVDPNAVDQMGDTALIIAASSGSSKIVRLLLENGADPNLEPRGRGPLSSATASGVLKNLLLSGISEVSRRKEMETALRQGNMIKARTIAASFPFDIKARLDSAFEAIESSRSSEIDEFLKKLSILASSGDMPAFGGHVLTNCICFWKISERSERTRLALEKGADPLSAPDPGLLEYAVRFRLMDIIRLLLPYYPKGHAHLGEGLLAACGMDALYDDRKGAAKSFNKEVDELVTVLLKHGADPNYRSGSGYTPLTVTLAAYPFNIKRLIDSGADPNLSGPNGYTALMTANPSNAKRLIEAGADVNAVNDKGETAMHLCRYVTKARMLRKSGADPCARSKAGVTPLMARASAGNEEMTGWLFKIKGALGHRDDNGANALFHAAWGGHMNIVRVLSDHGEDPLNIDGYGRNLVIISSIRHDFDLLAYGLEKGCDINHRDLQGMSALMHASGYGRCDMVKILLENGADQKLKDNQGHDARSRAKMLGHGAVVEILEKLRG